MTIAFVFPGQGSQSVGMLDAFLDVPGVSRLLKEAEDVLGAELVELIAKGPAETLSLTTNTQPAMLLASSVYFEAWRSAGAPLPTVLAGHSLGEYSAHVAAGTMTLAEGLALVRYRAEQMQAAVPVGVGGMAALLGLEEEKVEEICCTASSVGQVVPANKNAPGQIVIAGELAALEEAIRLAKEAGCRRAVMLPVSAPFHSPLMRTAAEALRERLSGMTLSAPALPVYANVDAAVHPVSELADVLARQAYSPVEWVRSVNAMLAAGVTDIVECGPGKVLTGLIKRIAPSVRLYNFSDKTTLEAAINALVDAQQPTP